MDHGNKRSTKNIGTAFFLNLVFTLIEIVGGLWTNSLAILSDAIHDLGDCISLGMAWIMERISGKERDQKYSYGYRRFSIMGAIITSAVLILGSLIIIFRAVPRLTTPESTDSLGMIYLAILGIAFNGFAAWRLHGGTSLNERTVFLHLLEDVLGWASILIGAILMYLFEWYIVDPILSIGIALFVLYNAIRNLKLSADIFLQKTPQPYDLDEIAGLIKRDKDVRDVHDLHLWTMDGEFHILTAHIVVKLDDLSWHEMIQLKRHLKRELKGIGIHHATLELETSEKECEID
ncbi:MAG: cation diffusion facilitator family transporter [Saprospiraceae bacterium]|nr:cation diffusion facilitator family transporter [Saprospiraceae bacterium]